jgi:hypothetical protein
LSASWIWRLIRLYWTDFYGSCVWPPSSPISLPTWWDFLLQLAKTYQQKLESDRGVPARSLTGSAVDGRQRKKTKYIYIFI